MGMLRSASFSRRPRAKSCEETRTATKEATATGVVSKIVRSASFSRSRKRSGTALKVPDARPP